MRTRTSSATFENTLAEAPGSCAAGADTAPPAADALASLSSLTGAGQSLACRVLGAAGTLAGPRGRHDFRQRLDAVRIVEEAQDAVDFEAAGRDADVPFELRSRQLSRDLQRGSHPEVTQLVVDDLEVLRLEREVHGADLSFVHRELAGDGELLAVLVEDLKTPDAHDVRLEIDAGVEA